jgi:hypothetical protein
MQQALLQQQSSGIEHACPLQQLAQRGHKSRVVRPSASFPYYVALHERVSYRASL